MTAKLLGIGSKEIEIEMQTKYVDEQWSVSLHATIRTAAAADALIQTLETVKPLLARNK